MDATQKACGEALNFFFQTEFEGSLENKKILILQGIPGAYTKYLKGHSQLDVVNYHAGTHRDWKSKDVTTIQDLSTLDALGSEYDLIIQLASKSESETMLHLAVATQKLAKDGLFIGAVHNRMGATRYRKEVGAVFEQVDSISKSKCRVLSAQNITKKLEVTALNTASLLPNSEYLTLPGVYGEKAIDKGSALLVKYLKDEHWSGIGADIGCGFGYLSGEILTTRHRVKQLWLYDIDSRAVEICKKNLMNHDSVKLYPHWVDVCESIPVERPVHWVIMNPPFHSGTAQDFELGKTFIKQAAKILRDGAPLFMVANLHLPYEETLHQHFRSVVELGSENGFKCFKAIK